MVQEQPSGRQIIPQQVVVPVQQGQPSGGDMGHHLGLGPQHAAAVAQGLQMSVSAVGDHADIGAADAGQIVHLAEIADAHFDDGHVEAVV